MAELKVLVFEYRPVDALSTSTVSLGEIAALRHKVRDNAMEWAASVSKLVLPVLSFTGRALRKSYKVFDSSRDNVAKKAENNSTSRL